MQFGVFTVGDVTPDPTTGRAPSEAERISSMVAIAMAWLGASFSGEERFARKISNG